ncbi:hypothetical protein VTK56DRAFT_1443 [Thermocarpiscus australiensis]
MTLIALWLLMTVLVEETAPIRTSLAPRWRRPSRASRAVGWWPAQSTYILNEQEHYRGSVDGRIGDRTWTMHELYLRRLRDGVRAGGRVGDVLAQQGQWDVCVRERVDDELICLRTSLGFGDSLGIRVCRGCGASAIWPSLTSDWGAQHTTLGSALGGLDMAMPRERSPASTSSMVGWYPDRGCPQGRCAAAAARRHGRLQPWLRTSRSTPATTQTGRT